MAAAAAELQRSISPEVEASFLFGEICDFLNGKPAVPGSITIAEPVSKHLLGLINSWPALSELIQRDEEDSRILHIPGNFVNNMGQSTFYMRPFSNGIVEIGGEYI